MKQTFDRIPALKNCYSKYSTPVFSVLSFFVPFAVYLLTLEKKLVGGDTTWYALYIPKMQVMVPTGYPAFSIIGKLFTLIPVGDLAYRLNLLSAVFGSLTILFLFLALNRFTKNSFISFSCALIFAFLYDYWTVANRFEFDTLNSFTMALILFASFLYTEKPERKYFYFFAAALGSSLTNHPIAFFIMPAFLLYIILVNPKIFKSLKAVLLGILYFFLPLTLYAWLPVRSIQGYGPVTTLKSFFYYITGRNITGEIHGGSFEGKTLETFSKVIRDFFLAIYNNYGILLLAVALAGLFFLFRKNLKFAICSVCAVILNIAIIGLYLGYCPPNYALNAMLFISIYIGAGFVFAMNKIFMLFDHKVFLGKRFFRYFIASALAIIIFAFPSYLLAFNYKKADLSRPMEIYNFWNEITDYVENGSVIYVSSSSENIGEFITTFEKPEKNIKIITSRDSRYNEENVRKDAAAGKKIYFVGIEKELIAVFNAKKISGYTWGRMNEYIVFYEYAGEKKNLKIDYEISKKEFKFGEKFEVLYRVINDNNTDLEITSIELELTENLEFSGTGAGSAVNMQPSFSQGKLMWVKTFPVKASDEMDIIIILQAATPGEAEINFRVTSQDYYFESKEIDINIYD
jgi:hypothetical protein